MMLNKRKLDQKYSAYVQTFSKPPRQEIWKQKDIRVLVLLLLIINCSELVECGMKNVTLIIEPPFVRRGQHAVLKCLYDLGGAPLYQAKFYRGSWEFYRYTPGESPSFKVFPIPIIQVDVRNSNATQVVLLNISFTLAGNFSCEVSADFPTFSTGTDIKVLQVVEFPDTKPQLFAENYRYEPGDILRANCSTPPSRPRAELQISLNNKVIGGLETTYYPVTSGLSMSRISMTMQLLESHFYPNFDGRRYNSLNGNYKYSGRPTLVLKCSAQIQNIYYDYSELDLVPPKDPIPARVTFGNRGAFLDYVMSFFESKESKAPLAAPQKFYLIFSAIVLIACKKLSSIPSQIC